MIMIFKHMPCAMVRHIIAAMWRPCGGHVAARGHVGEAEKPVFLLWQGQSQRNVMVMEDPAWPCAKCLVDLIIKQAKIVEISVRRCWKRHALSSHSHDWTWRRPRR
jgi:hypothetical protein